MTQPEPPVSESGREPLPLADQHLEAALVESQRLGFLGPGPVMFHVEHAMGFVDLLGPGGRVLDLGSGGGVPGLVLARHRSDLEVVLVDGMERRCRFLVSAAQQLGLEDRVTVICGRAEELAHRPELRGQFDTVVARSFGPPAVTAECGTGFVRRPGGTLLVSEPPEPSPDRWSVEGLQRLALELGNEVHNGVTGIRVLRATVPLDPQLPRRVGIPSKRPMF